jgi:hypothetical protein
MPGDYGDIPVIPFSIRPAASPVLALAFWLRPALAAPDRNPIW